MTCCRVIIENVCGYAVAYSYHLFTVAHVYSLEITMVIHIAKFDCGVALVRDKLLQFFTLYGQDILSHMCPRVLSIVSNAAANVTCYTAQMKLIMTEASTVYIG